MQSGRASSNSTPELPRIAVLGLWHLGCVMAACLAEGGFDVVGVDPDPAVIDALASGCLPVAEPGLEELIRDGQRSGRLRFDASAKRALGEVDVVWIAFDTPVDEEDRADSDWVIDRAHRLLLHAGQEVLVVVSSQLPAGSVERLAKLLEADRRGDLRFACVPENLRLGQALSSFRSPERVVAGVRDEAGKERLGAILMRFTECIEWMSVESAEMTKHALNCFLATSVAFINEIASLCESVGADAAEVARGLKSDVRIGQRAYLSPGDVFAGGTLARDVGAVNRLAEAHDLPAHLSRGVAASNGAHRMWARRAVGRLLREQAGEADAQETANGSGLSGKRVATWGLAYKPGTDTLRRSSALELCRWLREQDATVAAHDPAIDVLPESERDIELCLTPLSAARGADALVVCTPWPEYREVCAQELIDVMRTPIVIDAAGHVSATLGEDPAIRYARVGTRPR